VSFANCEGRCRNQISGVRRTTVRVFLVVIVQTSYHIQHTHIICMPPIMMNIHKHVWSWSRLLILEREQTQNTNGMQFLGSHSMVCLLCRGIAGQDDVETSYRHNSGWLKDSYSRSGGTCVAANYPRSVARRRSVDCRRNADYRKRVDFRRSVDCWRSVDPWRSVDYWRSVDCLSGRSVDY
jgi:hypothetical protein